MMVTKAQIAEIKAFLDNEGHTAMSDLIVFILEKQLVHIETQELQIKLLKREVTNFHKSVERANIKIKHLQQELNK
jgi:hypothetical protein